MVDSQKYNIGEYYRPLTAWAYAGYTFLFILPFIGIVFIIVFSLNNENINRRNYARSYLCWLLIALILFAIVMFTGLLPLITQQVRNSQFFS